MYKTGSTHLISLSYLALVGFRLDTQNIVVVWNHAGRVEGRLRELRAVQLDMN